VYVFCIFKLRLLSINGAFSVAPGLGLLAVEKTHKTLVEIRADIYVELVTVRLQNPSSAISYSLYFQACIARSEFDEAELHLDTLIGHLRTYDLWDAFSARVCLLQGYSAHAMGRTRRALECYRAVRALSVEDGLIWGLGWIGEIGLRTGFGPDSVGPSIEEWMAPEPGYDDVVPSVVETCLNGTWGLGMVCVGRVLEACFSGEIVRAKYASSLVYFLQSVDVQITSQATAEPCVEHRLSATRQLHALAHSLPHSRPLRTYLF
jgi:tetratricopeptide (TPR) repeat protein